MTKRFSLISLLLILMLAAGLGGAAAQDPAWVTWLYYESPAADGTGTDGFILLNDGTNVLETRPISAAMYPADYAPRFDGVGSYLNDVVASRDGRYVAMAFANSTGIVSPVNVLNTETGVISPVSIPADFPISAVAFGGFDPISDHLSLTYVGFTEGTEYPIAGGMLTWDPRANTIAGKILGTELAAAMGLDFPVAWTVMGPWVGGLVAFADNCYACEGRLDGEYSYWNPVNNAVVLGTGRYFTAFGDVLPSTGEYLYPVQNSAFPFDPIEGMFPVPNVIGYGLGPLPSWDTAASLPVVFQDNSLISLWNAASWVNNGARYMVAPEASATWFLLDRAGGRANVTPPPNSLFIHGTPSGWLSSAPDSAIGTQFLQTWVVSDTGLSTLDTSTSAVPRSYLNASFDVAYADPLTGTGFAPPMPSLGAASAPAAPTSGSIATTTCTGFTPLLAPNMDAQVTPGQPNRLRALPSTSAVILMDIPGGSIIRVMDGPFCEGSIGFWLVDYNGTIGYTAEGNGADYYLIGIVSAG
ncbi:MAG: hypothetical protein KME04_06790 [Pleurocapsa minor GSE-CHR-MK-17-07R]|jgi:hypothetical protein|nr:hypothetical protein [Pleurocapsa minor GSE-CHR-MK 17-07R]